MKEELTYRRKGNRTTVKLNGDFLGFIIREIGSDSSPRGGAYRTFHYPITATGKRLGACYSRKEAVQALMYVRDK